MGAREVLFGTHVEVVVFRIIQHGIQPLGEGMRMGPGGNPVLR